MRFMEFVSKFNSLPQPLVSQTGTGRSLVLNSRQIDGYVSPTISATDWRDDATVVLLEAPGAVGKSAAAQALADRLNWPLVLSEYAQVGSYSLSGVLQDALGFSSQFLHDVSIGDGGVVIDSLDEAHFKAGTENFLAFLENVRRVAGESSSQLDRSPSIILMSRADTAELIKLYFADAGCPLACATVDFFDRRGAEEFLETYLRQRFELSQRSDYNVALRAQKPFKSLRDRRFKQIGSVLTATSNFDLSVSWSRVNEFLGYAPVLVAMAESLAVANPSSESESLSASEQTGLLKDIIQHILEREQRKFRENLESKIIAVLPVTENDVVLESLYTPDEQISRLIAYVANQELSVPLPNSLSSTVRATYDEAVRTFLPDHPFLKGRQYASVVFSDFVKSQFFRQPLIRAAADVNVASMLDSVGPFFARFLAGGAKAAVTTIPENLIEATLSSWNQESDLVSSASSDVRVLLLGNEGAVTCVRESSDRDQETNQLEFSVSDITGVLDLKGPIRRATFISDQAIVLGGSTSLTLGPRTLISAQEIDVRSEIVRVETDRDSAFGAMIGSETITANRLVKVESGPRDLRVYCADPPSRLRPFSYEVRTISSVPFSAFTNLRAILLAFNSSTGKDSRLAVLAAKIDKKIIKSNESRIKIFDHLRAVEAVRQEGVLYFLDLAVLGAHGFGVQDLRSGSPSAPILEFLSDCFKEESA